MRSLKRELLNQHVLVPKLDFKSFVEAKQSTKVLIKYLRLNKHKIISTITTELIIIKTRAMSLWANNFPRFDDNKTHEVIYAWIKDKLHRSSP